VVTSPGVKIQPAASIPKAPGASGPGLGAAIIPPRMRTARGRSARKGFTVTNVALQTGVTFIDVPPVAPFGESQGEPTEGEKDHGS